MTSLVSLAYCFSFGALIFTGPLQRFLGQGVAAALICSAVTGIVISLKSGFPMSISGPEGNTAALLAAMMATLAPVLAAQPGDGALYLALAALALAGMITGVALFLLGINRLGRLARFIPYPVVAGFQAVSGWIMASGAIRMSTGVPVRISTLAGFAAPEAAAMLAVTAVWGGILWLITTRIKHFLALPMALAAAGLAADLAFNLLESAGYPIHGRDWMFTVANGTDVALPVLAHGFWHAPWMSLIQVSGEIAAIVLMAALTIVFTSTAIEQTWRIDVELNRELIIQGLANIASALTGGLVGHISLNRTLLAREAGGVGRTTGVAVALVGLGLLAGGLQHLVGSVPRFVLAGLLLELGVRLMWRWSVTSRGRLTMMEWLLVPAILFITAWFGVLIGFLAGVLGGCVIFVLSVSRVDIVKHRFTLDERPSALVRSSDEMALIAAHGAEVHIWQLASFIFFGSAYRLQERVATLIASAPPRMVILDFSAVSGIDSSAGSSLLRIEEMLRNRGIAHFVVGASADVRHVMAEAGALTGVIEEESLDVALEFGENTILEARGLHPAALPSFPDWLSESLGSRAYAQELIAVLEPAHYADQVHLCRAGDPTDSLLFIEHGRVSAENAVPGHAAIRQRVFGANTLVGETGFFLGIPRTADLRLYGAAKVWALSRPAYERLHSCNPDLTAALLTYTVRIQAERLAFTSRQVAALQR